MGCVSYFLPKSFETAKEQIKRAMARIKRREAIKEVFFIVPLWTVYSLQVEINTVNKPVNFVFSNLG